VRAHEFDHILGAAANVTGQEEFVVIGSQAILGSIDEPPGDLLQSMEADLYPLRNPADADKIDGALGDGSQFHASFGYYAHGVGPEAAKAPAGWESRLVRHEVSPRPGSDRRAIAWCLEAHDLVLSKCAAGRQRDWDYAKEAIVGGVVQGDILLTRVEGLPLPGPQRAEVTAMLRSMIPAS
jgi:Nucleotidyltransferase of unknown function (DUF6036)